MAEKESRTNASHTNAARTNSEQVYVCPSCRRVLVVCTRLAKRPWCTRCSRSMDEASNHIPSGQRPLFKGQG